MPVVLMALLLAGFAAGVTLRRDAATAWCVAALAAPVVFHCFVAGVALPFYWTAWLPFFLVVAVTGLDALARVGAGLVRRPGVHGLVALPLVAVALVLCLVDSRTLLGLQATGVARIESVMRHNRLHGPVIVAGLTATEVQTYLSRYSLTKGTSSPGRTDTVIVAQPRCRVTVDRSVRGLVSVNLKRHRLREVYRDGILTIYRADHPLTAPSYLDIVTQPAGGPLTGC
jgi:hypothetical protein